MPHTSPSKREKVLPESFQNGWLVFECDAERRRLAPVPEGWEELAELELEQLAMAADVVPARRGRLTTAADSPQTAPALAPPEVADGSGAANTTLVQAAQMQETLARVIEEICDQPRAPSLDTGELIRVEETLAIATRAAKQAVALRRASRGNVT